MAAFSRVPAGFFSGIVVTPEAAVLEVDRLGQVGRDRHDAVARHVVHPLDDFRDRAARAGHFAGLAEERDLHFLLGAGRRIRHLDASACSVGRFATRSRSSRNGSCVTSMLQLQVVLHLIADLDDAVGEPVAETVLVEHRHGDVHVRLELDEPLLRDR